MDFKEVLRDLNKARRRYRSVVSALALGADGVEWGAVRSSSAMPEDRSAEVGMRRNSCVLG